MLLAAAFIAGIVAAVLVAVAYVGYLIVHNHIGPQ